MTDQGEDAANISLQEDEIQALSSIFGDDWKTEDSIEHVHSIKIYQMKSDQSSTSNYVYFQVTLPKGYPSECPPIYCISAPWMSREYKNQLCSEIEDIYCKNSGESIIYLWIKKVRDFVNSLSDMNSILLQNEPDSDDTDIIDPAHFEKACKVSDTVLLQCEANELPNIYHGEPIIDRKSVFQGHASNVVTSDQVDHVLLKLKENRKVAIATHNIFAYRISRENGAFIQDYDDDGETKAGSVLLHLLQTLDVRDVLVVVSRWYGGIHLGPDRFKHISNAARKVLLSAGYIADKQDTTPKKSKKK